jgi:hypothetical protein
MKFLLWLLFFFAVSACTPPAIVTPPTSGCRNNEQECSDHACCPESNFVCGGDVVGCFADSCCPVGGVLGPSMTMKDGVRPKRRP